MRRTGTDALFLELEPIDIKPSVPTGRTGTEAEESVDRAWMINTYSSETWALFLEQGVAGVWGYPSGPATLQQEVRLCVSPSRASVRGLR
ncbi:MAG: hypothetical protein AAGF11_48955 [Myxococcota bacterium]